MGSVRVLIVATVGFTVLGFCVACSRQEAPKLKPAAAPPPPAPAAPPVVVRDAAADVVDAAADAADAGNARPRGRGKKASPPQSGGGGVKIEGSVARAEGEKVVRDAQPKLRACFEAGKGAGGRVSFKVTIDDRGRVTFAEIPRSTLSGGSEVETCMVRVLRDLRFPRAGGESSISFQMSFGR